MKKYELTEETKEFCGRTLHRIKALKDFGIIKAGELGGWVENERNLSQKGDAWVFDKACVFGNARVYGNARVAEHTLVFGNARVAGNTWVSGDALVFGNSTDEKEGTVE